MVYPASPACCSPPACQLLSGALHVLCCIGALSFCACYVCVCEGARAYECACVRAHVLAQMVLQFQHAALHVHAHARSLTPLTCSSLPVLSIIMRLT